MVGEQLRLNLEVNSASFFCKACLEERAMTEKSLDPRYCQFCFKFLMEEARQLPVGKRPRWIPKNHSGSADSHSTRQGRRTKPIPHTVA
jgi:hypothetical protein